MDKTNAKKLFMIFGGIILFIVIILYVQNRSKVYVSKTTVYKKPVSKPTSNRS